MAKGQELPELVDGSMELMLLLVERVRSGASAGENFSMVLKRLQTDKVFIEAGEGVSSVPEELRSYGKMQYFMLFLRTLKFIPRILEICFSKDGGKA